MNVVVDSSIAVKWLFEEPGSDAARRLLHGDAVLVGPDPLAVEFANVVPAPACHLDHSVRDCLSLALARSLNTRLITAGEKLATPLAGTDLAPLAEALG